MATAEAPELGLWEATPDIHPGPFDRSDAVFDRILNRMRELVRTSRYVMTAHGEEEMDNDDLTVFDIESVVLTGEVVERQLDRHTREWKYLVRGRTVADDMALVVGKIGPTGKFVVITVYRE